MLATAWTRRPIAALCLSIALAAVSLRSLTCGRSGASAAPSRPRFAVTMRHDGHDARSMERDVAIALEEALSAIPGVDGLSASCEYGKAELVVSFYRGTDAAMAYERVSDAAQGAHARLPSSVQRPEVRSYSGDGGPAWTAAVRLRDDGSGERGEAAESSLGRLLESVAKPAFARLPGAGLVETAGRAPGELSVEVDAARAASMGIGPSDIARALASTDVLASAGSLRLLDAEGSRALPIVADGRLSDELELAASALALADGSLRLGDLATVRRSSSRPEALSRVDGEPAYTVAVFGSGDERALSAALAAEAARLGDSHDLEFAILHDGGAELSRAFLSVLRATGLGSAAVVVAACIAAGRGASFAGGRLSRLGRARLVAASVPPLALLVAAAALVALGRNLDARTLTGLALGLGASSDALILALGQLGRAPTAEEGEAGHRRLAPVLASGSISSIAALLPLASLDELEADLSSLALSMALVNATTLLLTFILLPPLVLSGLRPSRGLEARGRSSKRSAGLGRRAARILAATLRSCARRPSVPLVAGALLSLAGLASFCSRPLDARGGAVGDSAYARVEFEAGLTVLDVDRRLAEASSKLKGRPGVGRVLSTARGGSGFLLLSLRGDASSRASALRALEGLDIPGGFVWIPRDSKGERSWTIAAYGDDGAECRRLATEAASLIALQPAVIGVALGFKPGPEAIVVRPDRPRMALAGVDFLSLCDTLRRSVFGPVAYKRTSPLGETDVRVWASPPGDGARGLEGVPVPTSGSPMPLGALASLTRERGEARPTRVDRRRAAFLRLRTKDIEASEAESLAMGCLSRLPRARGYSLEFDREALSAERRLRGATGAFALALLFSFMACAALAESMARPLLALAAMVPALAPPALVVALTGRAIDASVACAFIVVSGMAINASLYVASGLAARTGTGPLGLYRLVRGQIAPLAATSLAGIASTLPFLIAGDPDGLGRVLALVSATGTAASALSALIIVPALASAAPSKKGAIHD